MLISLNCVSLRHILESIDTTYKRGVIYVDSLSLVDCVESQHSTAIRVTIKKLIGPCKQVYKEHCQLTIFWTS